MRTGRPQSRHFLLAAGQRDTAESGTDAADRPGIHARSILWVSENDGALEQPSDIPQQKSEKKIVLRYPGKHGYHNCRI